MPSLGFLLLSSSFNKPSKCHPSPLSCQLVFLLAVPFPRTRLGVQSGTFRAGPLKRHWMEG